MDSSKLSLKFFLQPASQFDQKTVVPVFHQWIQNHSVDGHLLIDVADYHHVKNGPGTVLVAHEGNYSTDLGIGGAPGLLYTRKQPIDGDFAARLRQTFRHTLAAAAKLEQASELAGKLRFRTDNPIFRIYDRLLAPSDPTTFEAVRPALESVLAGLYGGPVKLDYTADAEDVFEVRITSSTSMDATALLAKL